MTSNASRITFTQKQKLFGKGMVLKDDTREMVSVLEKTEQQVRAFLVSFFPSHNLVECTIAVLEDNGSTLLSFSGGKKPIQTRFRAEVGFEGWIIQQREPILLQDLAHAVPKQQSIMDMPATGSLLGVPLLYETDCLGALVVHCSELSVFHTQLVKQLSLFAEQIALTIHTQQKVDRAQQFSNQLEMAIEASRRMSTHLLSPDALYRTVLLNVQRLIPYMHGFIHLYQAATQTLEVVAEWSGVRSTGSDQEETVHLRAVKVDKAPQYLRNISLSEPRTITASAALYRHSIVQDPQMINGAPSSQLAAPFISKGRLYGVLTLERSEAFTADELRIVRNLCAMVAASLENVELFHQVHLDQEQLRAMLFASTDGVALISADGHFVAANPAFSTIFGLVATQIVGIGCSDLFGCYRTEGLKQCSQQCMILRAVQSGQPLPYTELEFPIAGTSRLIGLSVTPVVTASGILCLLMARDVTTTRNATTVRANFISMITHELRSPLNSINGYLDLAISGVAGELNPQQHEFIQRARSGSEHLYSLLEDLLLISRADSGQMRMNRDVISLPDIVENAVEELELTAVDHEVTIVVDVTPNFPSIYADPVRIQQVLRNLISNALRFTAVGGQVTVFAAVEDKGHDMPFRSTEEDDTVRRMVRLEVRDTGIGIPSEYQERIFERFYQSPDQGLSRSRSGGQGLGLAIVKMIVELHGGNVSVVSNVGHGSTFICLLPCLLS